jgi:isopenicillin-N N-acyltransferase-like protein
MASHDTLLSRAFAVRTKTQTAVVSTAALLAAVGVARGDGFLTTVGSDDNKIPVVVVHGTPYQMGKKLGELTKRDAVEFVPTALQLAKTADPKRYSNEALDAAWKAIAPHTDPRFQEELRGLAEGTGLPVDVLRRGHALPVVGDYSCSSIAAWGVATKDGHLYQTRNLDWDMHLTAQDHPCIVIYIPDHGIPHANMTFAGCIGSNTGINAHGIVLSEMGDSPGREYPYDINGVHFTTLFRTVLYDADSLDKAIDLFKSAERIKKYHFVVGDGQHRKAVKMLAHAPRLVIWNDNDPTDELAPHVLKNVVYQDEGRGAFRPLQDAYGKIGAPDLISVACKIPIKGDNVLDVVYDATALEFWVAYAKKDIEAYKRPFVHVRLKDYLH